VTTSADTARLIDPRGIDVRSLTLEPPVRPGQLFCTIGNYRRQVIQAAEDAAGGARGGVAGQARSDAEAAVTLRRVRRAVRVPDQPGPRHGAGRDGARR
jgi:hypothetical protein